MSAVKGREGKGREGCVTENEADLLARRGTLFRTL